MKKLPRRGGTSLAARLLTGAWGALTDHERAWALMTARRAGRRAAGMDLGTPAPRRSRGTALRRCRWARQHAGLEGLDEVTLYLYVSAGTIPSEHHYVERVIERCCPERAARWWGAEVAERRADPRVCAFCDGYERKRRRILGLPPLPTHMADLQRFLWQAKEEERASARAWMETLETSYTSEAYAEQQRSVARWEYHWSQRHTDLAQMLLDAAAYLRRTRPDRRAT